MYQPHMPYTLRSNPGGAQQTMTREREFGLRKGGKRCRLLLVDPRPAIHQVARAACQRSREFQFLPPATNVEEARRLIKKFHPELVVIGEVPNPIGGLSTMIKKDPAIRVLILYTSQDLSIPKALQAGVIGFVDPEWTPTQFHKAFKIARAMMVIPRIVSTQITQGLRNEQAQRSLGPVLSTQQRRLAKLMAQGLSNKAMADQLGIEEKTVSNELILLYAKLRVHKRAEAVQRILDLGFARR